jgi:hypothetical protein
VAVEAQVALGGGEADQHGVVDLGREPGRAKDAREVEPLAAEPDPLTRVAAVDPEPLRGGGAEHRDRQPGRGRVEVAALRDGRPDRGKETEAGGLDAEAVGVDGGDVRAPVDLRVGRARPLDLRDRPDAGDHPRCRKRQLGRAPGERRSVGDGEQVGAEPVDLGQQPRLRGRGEAEHGHDRGHPDRDPERGQRGAQPSGAQADRGDPSQVGWRQPARDEGGHTHGSRLIGTIAG